MSLIELVVAVLAILLVAVPFLLAYFIIRMLVRRRDAQMLGNDEQVRLRQLMEAMLRMENRIANLETILIANNSQSATSNAEKESRRL